MQAKKISLLFFLLLFYLTAIGQRETHRFVQFNNSTGLSQSSVITIQQDQSGQMWFGTRDGLNKYDGTRFTVYQNNPTDTTSISNSDILSITEDHSGNIWVGTYNGLNKYDPKTEQFTRYYHSTHVNSLINNTIWSLLEIEGKLWVGTSKGLSIYDPEKDLFTNYKFDSGDLIGLPDSYIIKIFRTNKGNVFLGTAKGLCHVEKVGDDSIQFKKIQIFNSKNPGVEAIFVQDIAEDHLNNLWVGTKSNGLFKVPFNSNQLISINNSSNLDLINQDIRALNFDHENNLWIGSYEGINILNSNLEPIFSSNENPDYANLTKVKSIFKDRKGSVWVGTYYGGVNLWDRTNLNFSNLQENKNRNGLSYHVVSSITGNKNEVFFGTEGGGITVFNPVLNQTTFIQKSNFEKLRSDNIKSLCLNEDLLWIGTFTEGISVFDLKSKKIKSDFLPEDLKSQTKNLGVYSIIFHNDIFWFGTFGQGLIQYNPKTRESRTFQNQIDVNNSLTNNRIRCVLADSKNRLWVATQSGLNLLDLNNLDKENPNFLHYFFEDDINSGIDILTIFEDSKEQIWVGTKGQGLYKYENGRFDFQILEYGSQGISTINAILEDAQNHLWMSSNEGILKFNSKLGDFELYDQKSGLTGNEFKENSALLFKNNFLFFGGPTGVTFFDPNKITINTFAPQVLLTGLRIKNDLVKPNDSLNILKKSIRFTKSITLDYNKANFTIEYALPNFINSSNNLYSYRLQGLDNDWTTTSNSKVSYIIQNPGNYTFEIKGANNDGVWNNETTKLEIHVNPAPWRSWWAFTLYALMIGAALLGLILFLKSKTRLKHELELEHIENQRIEEINQAKLQFFTNISHEFRTPLTLILGPLQQILSDYKGSNKMYKKLMIIENNANHLLQLINRLMDFRKMESNHLKLQTAEGNIVKFLQEIYLSFSEFAKNGDYTYDFETPEDPIIIYFDRGKLERVFFNLISNAFRYTPHGGSIKVKLIPKDRELIIQIEDSGVGISEKYIDKIFDRFFEVPIHNEPQKNYNKGTGIGLAIAKSMVELHKGKIEVQSEASKGTTFSVFLPFGKEHLNEDEIITDFKISDDLSQYESQVGTNNSIIEDDIEDFYSTENLMKVLIVEDNEPLRKFIKNLLKSDYEIIEAENGKIALQKTLEHMPDLVISDVIMPEMVGTELCSQIKQNIHTSHIPVILLTSRTSLIYKFEGLESGADEYISKPFNVKEFKLRIKNILASTQRLKQKFINENNFSPSEITVSSLDEKLLKSAFKIVENNISNELFDIPFFCSELGVSRTMLFTKIKAWTNLTPNEFIHEIRMKRAAQLLEQNKINISQISYKVGFKNPKYFSKCFQKKYGITPSQYQNKFHNTFDEISEKNP